MKLSWSKSSRLLRRIAFSCLIKYQTEITIIHAGTNDLTNEINMLHNAKKTVKEPTTKLPKVKIAFSRLITRKDKKKIRQKC